MEFEYMSSDYAAISEQREFKRKRIEQLILELANDPSQIDTRFGDSVVFDWRNVRIRYIDSLSIWPPTRTEESYLMTFYIMNEIFIQENGSDRDVLECLQLMKSLPNPIPDKNIMQCIKRKASLSTLKYLRYIESNISADPIGYKFESSLSKKWRDFSKKWCDYYILNWYSKAFAKTLIG